MSIQCILIKLVIIKYIDITHYLNTSFYINDIEETESILEFMWLIICTLKVISFNTSRTGPFKLFKRPFPEILTILTL